MPGSSRSRPILFAYDRTIAELHTNRTWLDNFCRGLRQWLGNSQRTGAG